ncbi:hypothetical protein SNE40_010703 [Patella caerulea]
MIGTYKDGGLNLPDISLKIAALRLNMVRKYFNTNISCIWKECMTLFLKQYKDMNMSHNVFHILLDLKFVKLLPPFYQELLKAWYTISDYHFIEPDNYNDIINQPLFDNRYIVDNEKPLYFDSFIKAGIKQIADICYIYVPKFLPNDVIIDEIHNDDPEINENVIEQNYELLLATIPQKWKDVINTRCKQEESVPKLSLRINDKVCNSDCLTTKFVYNILRKEKFKEASSIPFWEGQGTILDTDAWKRHMSRWKDSQTVELDFKILHNIVYTKEKLFRFNITENDLCPVCIQEVEDLRHLFISCSCITIFKEYIRDIVENFYTNTNISIPDFEYFLLFGVKSKHNKHHIFINLVLAFYRQVVYIQRMSSLKKRTIINLKSLFKKKLLNHLKYILLHDTLTVSAVILPDNSCIMIENNNNIVHNFPP